MVSNKRDDGIVGKTIFFQSCQDPANLGIHVGRCSIVTLSHQQLKGSKFSKREIESKVSFELTLSKLFRTFNLFLNMTIKVKKSSYFLQKRITCTHNAFMKTVILFSGFPIVSTTLSINDIQTAYIFILDKRPFKP